MGPVDPKVEILVRTLCWQATAVVVLQFPTSIGLALHSLQSHSPSGISSSSRGGSLTKEIDNQKRELPARKTYTMNYYETAEDLLTVSLFELIKTDGKF